MTSAATASYPKKRAHDEESTLSHELQSPPSPIPDFRPYMATRQRKRRRINGAIEVAGSKESSVIVPAKGDGPWERVERTRIVHDHSTPPAEHFDQNDKGGVVRRTPSNKGLPTHNIDEINADWGDHVLALYNPLNLYPRDSLRVASPDHWELVPTSVAEITTCSTVESVCVSLVNDRTNDIRILCQKINQLSALVHGENDLNLALFDLAMRMVVGKIVDTGYRSKWRGIDIKAAIYAVRQAVNVASSFGYEKLWDWKLEVEFQDYEEFTDEAETKRWTRFALAMDTNESTLWNHFSQQGMLSTDLDFGFLPCKGLGWVVANFTRHRLYFLEADSVTISKTENHGMFSLAFVIPETGSTNTPSRVLFPQVSARQMLKRSKLNLEEWYNINN